MLLATDLIVSKLGQVTSTMAEVSNGYAAHGVDIFLALHIMQLGSVTSLKDDERSRALLPQRLAEAMHLIALIRGIQIFI